MLGGLVTKSLSSFSITLTAPAGSVTPGAGPTESQNAVIRFTGTLTGNCSVTIPLPGFYIIDNRCTVGAFFVQVRGATATEVVGAPPGQAVLIYNDGANVRFVGTPPVGSTMRLPVAATPLWILGCSVNPWLPMDGTVYNISSYPFLGALLGSTFGGDGITTFAVPDTKNRNIVSTGTRITAGVSGVDGAIRGSAGGSQSHLLTAAESAVLAYTDSGHQHQVGFNNVAVTLGGAVIQYLTALPGDGNRATSSGQANISSNAGGAAHTVLNPTLVFGMDFLKT